MPNISRKKKIAAFGCGYFYVISFYLSNKADLTKQCLLRTSFVPSSSLLRIRAEDGTDQSCTRHESKPGKTLTGADIQHGSVQQRICAFISSYYLLAQIHHHSFTILHICAGGEVKQKKPHRNAAFVKNLSIL
jgi:hypothetical protein